MIDRSYQRRQAMISTVAAFITGTLTIALYAGATVVIVHFVVKFW